MFKIFQKSHAHILARVLLVNFFILAILHVFFVAVDLFSANHPLANLTPFFDLDSERNLPTYYSGVVLALIGLTAWRLRKKAKIFIHKVFWIVMAVFFTYWALDEVLIWHERLAQPIREILQIGYDSVFYHAWVIAAMCLISFTGIFILINNHLSSRPLTKKQRDLLIIIFIFMSGIVLLEILGTKIYAYPRLYRLGVVPLEELFEIGMASYVLVKLAHY